MHPMTIYDTAVREHDLATAQRAREDVVRLRRRDRGAVASARHTSGRFHRSVPADQHSTGRPAVA